MKLPVIEVRKRGVTVMPEVSVVLSKDGATSRHNLVGNTLLHVIDSGGELWSFEYRGHNHAGLRKVFSKYIWNVSRDRYDVVAHGHASVQRFREILSPLLSAKSPDDRELAAALLESVAHVAPDQLLAEHLVLLNL